MHPSYVHASTQRPPPLPPTHHQPTENKRYFGPGPVVDAVPGLFVKLAAIHAALCLAGTLLLRDPAYKKIDDARATTNGTGGGGSGRRVVGGADGSGGSPLRRRLYDEDGDGEEEEDDEESSSGTPKLPRAGAGGGDGDGDDDDDEDVDLTPSQLLRTPQAWHVSLAFLLGSLSGLVTLSTYKSYGISEFLDDRFFSFVVGSVASACNAAGRVLWGALSDRVGAYRTLRTASLLQALALFTWNLTIDPLHSKWAFAAWVGAVCLCHGGGFAVYPALTADLFGKTNAAANFGFIFLLYGIFSLIGLAVLPRLSAALSPLNYFLGAIALGAAVNITLIDRCYPAHRLHNANGGGGSPSKARVAAAAAAAEAQGNGFALLSGAAGASGGGGSSAASLS